MGQELGATQQALLRLLLHNKDGLTIEALTRGLKVSRNAVRQHLAVLERDGKVARGPTQPTGGRPEQTYRLTPMGQELFPRQYSWFAEMLVDGLRDRLGAGEVARQFEALGKQAGRKIREGFSGEDSAQNRIADLAGKMTRLGYEARAAKGEPEIEAQNCVFHKLALRNPDVCRFDLALLSAATGQDVEHKTCMARGDGKCRFRFVDAKKPRRRG